MIMKRISVFIMCLFCFVCTVPLFAQSVDTDSTEISIYNEIISYKITGYYPGVVDRTDFLKKNYPESVFINPALVLKGEALVNLGKMFFGLVLQLFCKCNTFKNKKLKNETV